VHGENLKLKRNYLRRIAWSSAIIWWNSMAFTCSWLSCYIQYRQHIHTSYIPFCKNRQAAKKIKYSYHVYELSTKFNRIPNCTYMWMIPLMRHWNPLNIFILIMTTIICYHVTWQPWKIEIFKDIRI